MSLLTVVIIISLVLTIAVLVIGLGSMGVGGEFDEKYSIRLMYARVGMQAVTLMLLFFAIYLANT